jgi:PAS domain S-box-containing protein
MAKILAIDDNLDNLISLKAVISDTFPEATLLTSTNGLQGIELAVAEDPDVILLDIFMPGMDGFEVCSRLKQQAHVCDIPIVFLTAQKGDKESRIKALEVGAEAFLSKPIEVIELTAQIRAMLKIRLANKRNRDEKERLEALVHERTKQLERELEDRKQAEQTLIERESLLRTLIDSAPFDIWARDKNGVGILENEYSVAHFGSIIGKKPDDSNVTSEIADRWKANNQLVMNGEVVNSECTYVIDGKELFFNQILAPIVVNGSSEGIIGFNIEITEKKKADQAIKETNDFNNSLLRTIPFGMDIVDEHGNILFISDYLNTLLGKDVHGEKCWDIYRDDQLKCPDCPLKDGIEVGKTSICEATSVLGGRTFQIIHTGMMFKGRKALLEILQDITERKHAEEQIKTLGKAIEQGPSSIVITNLKGDIEFVNHRFTEITQYAPEEVLGKKPRIFNPGHLNEKDAEGLWSTLNEGKIWKGEVVNRKKDQTSFWEEVTISTLTDADGNISNFILIMDDITTKKQMIDELIVAKGKAEESDRLKSAFLANMSHEIRTPLNSILGFTELLSDPAIQTNANQRLEYARIINTSGANLLTIINDIIDISKIEAGQVHVRKSRFSAQELIISIWKEYGLKAQNKGIELKIDNALPEQNIEIESDAAKIKQVLINFVGNAIKFTEKGTVTIGMRVNGESVLFYVKDTGIGIPKEFHGHIFERFRQIEGSATRKYGGNGLGLAISKSLIELLGGSIGMESEEGKGATFYISLPERRAIQKHQKT